MLDKSKIAHRFFSCYEGMTPLQIGKIHNVKRVTVAIWASRHTISWSKLKHLCDSQDINWDWLLEGVGEKQRSTERPKNSKRKTQKFDKSGINRRFFSLFEGKKQCGIAAELDVAENTVSTWKNNVRQVPWRRMEYAVARFNVRWDWLIDGLEPKYREPNDQHAE